MQKQYVDLVIDALLDEGFSVEEAEALFTSRISISRSIRSARKLRKQTIIVLYAGL